MGTLDYGRIALCFFSLLFMLAGRLAFFVSACLRFELIVFGICRNHSSFLERASKQASQPANFFTSLFFPLSSTSEEMR